MRGMSGRGETRKEQLGPRRSSRPPWAPALEGEFTSVSTCLSQNTSGCFCPAATSGYPTHSCSDGAVRIGDVSKSMSAPFPGDAKFTTSSCAQALQPGRISCDDFPPLQASAGTRNLHNFGKMVQPPAQWSRNYVPFGAWSSPYVPGSGVTHHVTPIPANPPPRQSAALGSSAVEIHARLPPSRTRGSDPKDTRSRGSVENRCQNRRENSASEKSSCCRKNKKKSYNSRVFERTTEAPCPGTASSRQSFGGSRTNSRSEVSALDETRTMQSSLHSSEQIVCNMSIPSHARASHSCQSLKHRVAVQGACVPKSCCFKGTYSEPFAKTSVVAPQADCCTQGCRGQASGMFSHGFPTATRAGVTRNAQHLGVCTPAAAPQPRSPHYAQQAAAATPGEEVPESDWCPGFVWAFAPEHEYSSPISSQEVSSASQRDPQRWTSVENKGSKMGDFFASYRNPARCPTSCQPYGETFPTGSAPVDQLAYQNWLAFQEELQAEQFSDRTPQGEGTGQQGAGMTYTDAGMATYNPQTPTWGTHSETTTDFQVDKGDGQSLYFSGAFFGPDDVTSAWLGGAPQVQDLGQGWANERTVHGSIPTGASSPDNFAEGNGMDELNSMRMVYLGDGTTGGMFSSSYIPYQGYEAYGSPPDYDQAVPYGEEDPQYAGLCPGHQTAYASPMLSNQADQPTGDSLVDAAWQYYPPFPQTVPQDLGSSQTPNTATPLSSTWDLSKGLPPEFVPASMRNKEKKQGGWKDSAQDTAQRSVWEECCACSPMTSPNRWCQMDIRASLQDEDPAIAAVVLSPPREVAAARQNASCHSLHSEATPTLHPWQSEGQTQLRHHSTDQESKHSEKRPSEPEDNDGDYSPVPHCPNVIEDSIEDLVQYLEGLDYTQGQGVVKHLSKASRQSKPQVGDGPPESKPDTHTERVSGTMAGDTKDQKEFPVKDSQVPPEKEAGSGVADEETHGQTRPVSTGEIGVSLSDPSLRSLPSIPIESNKE